MQDQDYLALYKRLIAKKLPLADNPDQWKQRDMEALAELIFEKSGVRLSLSTLKRIWKPDFNQTPHPSTLDALVSALDYSSWMEFKQEHQSHESTRPVSNPKSTTVKRKAGLLALGLTAGLVLLVALMPKISRSKAPVAHGPVSFSADKTVATGVPNTVIFKYDLKQVEADSFFLQQSWNEVHKQPLDATSGYFSSTYYTPGFHRAKLIANDSLLKRVKVHIKTDGWMALARYSSNDLVPIYLRDPQITDGPRLQVTSNQLSAAGVDLSRNFVLSYHNVKDFGGIHSDDFELQTRIRNDSLGNYACPQATITIICEEHIFYVPITTPGCVGNLALKFGETIHENTNSDLSVFGRQVYNWQDIRILVEQKQAQVWLDGKMVFETSFKEDFGPIMGTVISFRGPGSVDGFSLTAPTQSIAAHQENHTN